MRHEHRRWAFLLALALSFAAAYAQRPLFTSNQNTYFLHGLAWAELGELEHDWTAATTTTVPLFNVYVAALLRTDLLHASYFVHGSLIVVYIGSLLALFLHLRPRASSAGLALGTLFLAALHTDAFTIPWPSFEYLRVHLTEGLAGQPLLRPFHQPSGFGVGLLAALALFTRGHLVPAVVIATVTTWFHAIYLLPAGLLVLTMAALHVRHDRAETLRAIGLFALGVLPPLAWAASFVEGGAEAASILVHRRFPHHADLATWFDATSVAQICWALFGIALVARLPRIAVPLAAWAAAALLLTAFQAWWMDDRLALALPWRPFVLLVPTATALWSLELAHRLAHRLPELLRRVALVGATLGLLTLAAWGVSTTHQRVEAHIPSALALHVRASCQPHHQLLVPLRMAAFRLASWCPVYVDWKTHPYRGPEVKRWYARVERARAVYAAKTEAELRQALKPLRRAGVTHLVSDRKHRAPFAEVAREIWSDDRYTLFELPARKER